MESIVASGQDFLVGPLNFEVLQDQASYVTSRRNTQTFANVSEVGPQSVKSLKVQLADPSGFLDLSTLCFSFTVVNNGALPLQPLTAIPHNWFRRLIIKCSGALIEDVNDVGRTEEMFTRYMSAAKRMNLASMGHGAIGGSARGDDMFAYPIAHGHEKKVVWRPQTSGLLNCGKFLPAMLLGGGGLTIELELAQADEAVRDSATDSEAYSLIDIVCPSLIHT